MHHGPGDRSQLCDNPRTQNTKSEGMDTSHTQTVEGRHHMEHTVQGLGKLVGDHERSSTSQSEHSQSQSQRWRSKTDGCCFSSPTLLQRRRVHRDSRSCSSHRHQWLQGGVHLRRCGRRRPGSGRADLGRKAALDTCRRQRLTGEHHTEAEGSDAKLLDEREQS